MAGSGEFTVPPNHDETGYPHIVDVGLGQGLLEDTLELLELETEMEHYLDSL